jgi:hypothetical protein
MGKLIKLAGLEHNSKSIKSDLFRVLQTHEASLTAKAITIRRKALADYLKIKNKWISLTDELKNAFQPPGDLDKELYEDDAVHAVPDTSSKGKAPKKQR